ncbi:MAG TPA: hypothetical protein VN667_06875 [Burkholderiales bacterium]|nr:hypothetical protein [Burkholderiales bacterium]
MSLETSAERSSTSRLPAQQIVSCDDVACELLIDPIPRPEPPEFKVRLKPEQPYVLLVDNNKPNSMAILKATQAELRARGVEVREEIPIKERAGTAMPAAMLDALAKEKGLVLCGVND